MRKSKLKRQLLATLLAVAMAFTSVSLTPFGAATAHAENAVLKAGDYYIMNTATGGLLNAGNSYGTQASALDYGQLVTLEMQDATNGTYYINTHIYNRKDSSGNKLRHYLNANGYMDGDPSPLTIARCEDDSDSFTISANSKYLTASEEGTDTTVTFEYGKSDLSKWRFFTRQEFMDYAMENAIENNPVDITSLIYDSDFGFHNDYFDKWTIRYKAVKETAEADRGKGAYYYRCYEGYRDFGISNQPVGQTTICEQEIKDITIPNGVYELSVQAFYEPYEGFESPATYYINNSGQNIMNIVSGSVKGLDGAWNSFKEGKYQNDFHQVTVTNHKLKVGLQMPKDGNWVAWGGFTLRLVKVDDTDYVEHLKAKIDDASGHVELTNESKAKIDAAQKLYDKSTDARKNLVDSTRVEALAKAKADYEAAAAVADQIDAIGPVELTNESKAKVDTAKEAYDNLTNDQKALVDAKNGNSSTAAYDKFYKLFDDIGGQDGFDNELANRVADKIAKIYPVEFTDDCKTKIEEAKEAYKALTEAQQKILQDKGELKKLEDAEAKYEAKKKAAPVIAMIEEIPPLAEITREEDCKAKIAAAKAAYEALEEQKYKDEVTNLQDLKNAEERYEWLKDNENHAAVAIVKAKIRAIERDGVSFTVDCRLAIKEAEEAYDRLTEEQRDLISDDEKAELEGILSKAKADYAVLKAAAKPLLTNGDYYIVNASTGRYLNAGNNGGTQASALTYGQLMTIAVNESDNTCTIDTHYGNDDGHYFGGNGNVNRPEGESQLTIEKCKSGNLSISTVDGKFLTAPAKDAGSTVVSFEAKKSARSEWLFLSREELIEKAVKEVNKDNPVDVTSLIMDSGFGVHNNYFDKWNGDAVDKGGPSDNQCVQKNNEVFNSYQELKKVPNGEYTLEVQGFYNADDSAAPPVYYINDEVQPLMKREADASGGDVPGDIGGASDAFTAGRYWNASIRVAVTNHTLKVGVKAEDANSWVVWDNFKLTLVNADRELADRVEAKIDAIGKVELTNESKEKLEEAKEAYDALTDEQKKLVDEGNGGKLKEAEETFDALLKGIGGEEKFDETLAERAIAKIDAIGPVTEDTFTVECRLAIKEAREAYNALTDVQKKIVQDAQKLITLRDAERAYEALEAAAKPLLAADDYYIVNAVTGRYLNAGNENQTQASALTYGQLMRFAVNEDGKTYTIDTYYLNEGKRYLGSNGFLDGTADPLKIEKCKNGNLSISNDKGEVLTENSTSTVVTFTAEKSAASEWLILSRKQLMEKAVKVVSPDNAVDVTSLISDPNFDIYNERFSEWKVKEDDASRPNKSGMDVNQNVQFENAVKDVYQVLKDVPNGVYELEVQGFYRADDDSTKPAVYYINETEKNLMTIEDDAKKNKTDGWSEQRPDGNGVWVPDGTVDCSLCFTAGAYKNDPIRVTVTDHELRIGVKTTDAKSWVCWDNFTLKLLDVKVPDVLAMFKAIGDEGEDGQKVITPTKRCKKQIEDAEAAYEALTDVQRGYITEAQLQVLKDARKTFDDLLKENPGALDQESADEVIAKIGNVPAPGQIALTDAEGIAKIEAAREAYDALTGAQKELITDEQLKPLTDAETAYKNLVVAKINAIGKVTFTRECRLAIEEARAAYEAMKPYHQKLLVNADELKVLTDAEAAYAELAKTPILAKDNYYIVNADSGRYLNAGNGEQIQASVLTYGQLMTIAVEAGDNTTYTIDTHYTKDEKHYLGSTGFFNSAATPLKIEKCKNSGNFIICNADGEFLTAPADESTVVSFAAEKSARSEWLILSRAQLVEKLLKDVKKNPVDITSLILESGFDRYNDYIDKWECKDAEGNDVSYTKGGEAANYCVEAPSGVFDFCQKLENMPNGVYELSVQGFYRKDADTEKPPVYYVNDTTEALKTIEADGNSVQDEANGWSEERDGKWVPADMGSASKCFAAGKYKNKSIRVTVTNHTLTVGVKATDTSSWVVWDNFTLTLVNADREYADRVIDLIEDIDTDTTDLDEYKAKLEAAEEAYDKLTDEQKNLVGDDKKAELDAARTEYNRLKAIADVEALIAAIDDEVKLESGSQITRAQTAYDKLTSEQQQSVKNAQKLKDAKARYDELVAGASQEQLDQAAANTAIKLIDDIGTVDADNLDEYKKKIDAARQEYDGLSDEAKALVEAAGKLTVLEAAEAKYNELKAAEVEALIDEIPALEQIALTDDCKAAIDNADEAYRAYLELVGEHQQDLVKEHGKWKTLDDAKKRYDDLEAADEVITKINNIVTATPANLADCESQINAAQGEYDKLSDAAQAIVRDRGKLTELTNKKTKYENVKAAVPVINLIGQIGTVTLDSKSKVTAAEDAFNALKTEAQSEVTNRQILTDARARYNDLEAADAVVKKINAIGTVDASAACKARIDDAEKAYNALSVAQRVIVGEANLKKITDAKAQNNKLAEEQSAVVKLKQDLATSVANATKLDYKKYKQDQNWTVFQTALTQAKTIQNTPNATKDQVQKAMTDLNTAIQRLTPADPPVQPANKTELNAAIAAAKKLKQKTYTPSTWKNFNAALIAANAVAAKPAATQQEVTNATATLKAKQKALKKAVNKITITNKVTGSKTFKIAAGKKVTLKATATPKDASSSVTWSVDKKSKKYATVNKKTGAVTIKKKPIGKKVTIIATAKDGSKKTKKATITVMKNAVTKVTLKAAKKVKAGRATTIKAAVRTNGKKANKALFFSLDKKSAKYASINSKGKLKTKKTGKGKKVTVTATATDGTNKKAKVTITLTK